jgi:mono/diheme cytochrome c family protein
MRTRILSLAAAFAFSTAAAVASSPFAGQTPSAPPGDVAKGKTAFQRTGCWQCHGHEGQGGREGARIAAPVPMQFAAFSKFVRTTKRSMPPYTEKVLSEQELADIYAYLRSIPPAPDFTSIPLLNALMPR